MSNDINGKKCAGCGAYLFDEDDVVFCPVCGAPHHRECYNSKGKCAFESLHGTDRQYDKVQEQQKEPEQPKQGRKVYAKPDDTVNPMNFLQIDLLGGIPEDFDLGDGVTATEAKQFVVSNTHRYIPKFAAAKNGKRASFNWLAFLVPPVWFLSRKMYKAGIFTLALSVALTLLTFPFMLQFQEIINTSEAKNILEVCMLLVENFKEFEITGFIASFVASALNVLLSVLCGIFGDYFYRNHAIGKINEIKKEGLDVSENLFKKGGVSLLAAAIGFFVLRYLPSIIFNFIA